MKTIKLSLFLVGFIFFGSTNAQQWDSSLLSELKNSQEVSFFDIQEAFQKYEIENNIVSGKVKLPNGDLSKVPGWKQYKRWEYFWEQRVDPATGKFPEYNSLKIYDEYLTKLKSSIKNSISGNWQDLGSETSTSGYAGLGRINCISFHPTDTNVYWVGAPSGGIWKTADDGETWTVLSDNNPVLGVSDIAVPSDYEISQTLYIATGDRDGGSVWSLGGSSYDNNSVGVLKTIDGGLSWSTTGLSFSVSDEYTIGRLLIHPTDNTILYAATTAGVYKSTNSGTNWTYLSVNAFIDMEFQPGNPLVMYGSTKSWSDTKIYKSTNGGANWTEVHSVPGRRTELAVTPDEPNWVYAIAANSERGLEGVYKSVDQGANFSAVLVGVAESTSCLGYYSDGSGDNTGQGSYDLAIAVDPNDASKIYFGGVNSWRSLDGGATWEIMNMWTSGSSYNISGVPVVHADKHCLVFRNSSSVLFEGNDGGIYKATTNGNAWTDKSNGLGINQLYRFSVSQTIKDMVLAGLQDNGSKMLYNGNWSDVTGGDGMECKIDYSDANIQYATYVSGTLYRTENSWSSKVTISDNIGAGDLSGAWVAPFVMHPTNPSVLFVGYEEIWKTDDKGDTFTQMSSFNSGENLNVLDISPSNPLKLVAGTRSQISLSLNEGVNWQDITSNLPVGTSSITNVIFKHDDENTLWVTMGNYSGNQVYESVNGGQNWTNISLGLPALPAMSIIQNVQNTSVNELYVSMDVGVYVKYGAADWQMFSEGMPNVLVTDLDIYYDNVNSANNRLYAATFGRGVWASELFDNTGVENPKNFAINNITSSQISLSWILNEANDSILLVFSTDGVFGTLDAAINYQPGYQIAGGGEVLEYSKKMSFDHTALTSNTSYFYKIWSKGADNKYSSGTILQATTGCATVSLPYSEDFSETSLPFCWTQVNSSGVTDRWNVFSSNEAGGVASELKAIFEDVQNASSKVVLPQIDPNGAQQLQFSYNIFFNTYDTGVQLKLQASTDKETWTDIDILVESSATTNVGPVRDTVIFDLAFGDVPTYFALSLVGDLFAFDYVYVDNISIDGLYGEPGSPNWSSIPNQTIYSNESFTDINLKNFVTDDITTVDNLVYSYENATNLAVSIVNGLASVSAIDPNWLGSETISFIATDEASMIGTTQVIFTVLAANEAPVVGAIPDQTINQGEEFTDISLDNYVEDDYTADVNIVWSISNSDYYTINIVDRLLQIEVKEASWFGTETIQLTASDEADLFSTVDIVFTVNYVNFAPEITAIANQTIKKGESFEIIYLNEFVSDNSTHDTDIVWTIIGEQNLFVDITAQVAVITPVDTNWIGEESLEFVATDEEGASDNVDIVFTIEDNVGIFSLNENSHRISIYPNPTTGDFIIELLGNRHYRATVSILDISGSLVYRKTFVESDKEILISSQKLSKGIYLVSYTTKEFVATRKLIVK